MDTAFSTSNHKRRTWLACLFGLALSTSVGLAAVDHFGQVTFAGLPVPGATVTASQGDKQFVTSTDQQGIYKLPDLADGVWMIRVDMLGFSTLSQDVTMASDSPPSMWELKLRAFEEIARDIPPRAVEPPTPGATVPLKPETTANKAAAGDKTTGERTTAATVRRKPDTPGPPSSGTTNGPSLPQPAPQRGFQRAGVNASTPVPVAANAPPPAADAAAGGSDSPFGAADGLLINGSVNNGAASPFAQLAAFGNNRRGGRSLYTGGAAVILGNSAFDARPFSFASQDTAKPDYTDVQVAGQFGGPLKIPWLFKNPSNVFVGYQRMSDHSAVTQPAVMPTALERAGDFSQSRDAFGRPVQIVDPDTRAPFPGSVIPRDRISSQAGSLLGYYPLPNLDGGNRYNFQAPLVTVTRQDSIQSRITQPPFGRNQTYGNVAYQRTTTESTNVFGFTDATTVSGIDTAVNWSRRFSQFFSLRLRYQFTRLATEVTPYFANRTNVSGDAGISGNNQDPVNWGPPTLSFASGVEGLTSAQYASNSNRTHVWSAESTASRGRHNITFGGGVHRQQFDVLSQQNARGAFAFTGATTGSDLADFLLGVPRTSSIAFGNADRYLRASAYEAYVTDDWRLSPGLTINAGVRWEYEAPFTELFGRLVNLDVAPGFSAVSSVVATDPVGGLTGVRYPESLVRPDRRGVQPRVGVAWRPIPGSSLIVRGGYGVYRNTNVYQSIALQLAQQPPLSKAFNVENSPAHRLSLADGFVTPAGTTPNTFAVDPDFHVGYAENWQASVQKDLPASLTILATYLEQKGAG